jgi:DNA recombination protein RmuC
MSNNSESLYIFISILAIFCLCCCVIIFNFWLKAKSAVAIAERDLSLLLQENATLKASIETLNSEKRQLQNQLDFEKSAKNAVEISLKLLEQKIAMLNDQINDWEKAKQEHLNIAKSSMLEVSTQLSNKLLEDHKRESDHQKKQTEENIKKTTEELTRNFTSIFEVIKSFNDRVVKSESLIEKVKNSLLNPQSSGFVSETILENILQNSGLKRDRDYFLQFSFTSEEKAMLRPDAIITLPNDNILVVDSKSSKFLVNFDASSPEDFDKNFKASLNRQLNSLTSKDYKNQIIEFYKNKLGKNISVMHTIMFLPTDATLEKAYELDFGFIEKAWSQNIIPVGPSGLVSVLIQARLFIEKSMQFENYSVIIEEIKKLLDSIAKMHSNIESLGKSISQSATRFNSLSNNLNKNLIQKKDKFDSLGILSDGLKGLNLIEFLHMGSQNDA